jgi:hypothetical protein
VRDTFEELSQTDLDLLSLGGRYLMCFIVCEMLQINVSDQVHNHSIVMNRMRRRKHDTEVNGEVEVDTVCPLAPEFEESLS